MHPKHRLRRWGPAITLMALIFAFSSIPKGTLIPDFDVWDIVIKKTAHVLIYAALANAYLWGVTGWRQVRPRSLCVALLLTAAYAATDEIHQHFVPGREGKLLDVGIDSLGAAAGLALWWASRRRWTRTREMSPATK